MALRSHRTARKMMQAIALCVAGCRLLILSAAQVDARIQRITFEHGELANNVESEHDSQLCRGCFSRLELRNSLRCEQPILWSSSGEICASLHTSMKRLQLYCMLLDGHDDLKHDRIRMLCVRPPSTPAAETGDINRNHSSSKKHASRSLRDASSSAITSSRADFNERESEREGF